MERLTFIDSHDESDDRRTRGVEGGIESISTDKSSKQSIVAKEIALDIARPSIKQTYRNIQSNE